MEARSGEGRSIDIDVQFLGRIRTLEEPSRGNASILLGQGGPPAIYATASHSNGDPAAKSPGSA